MIMKSIASNGKTKVKTVNKNLLKKKILIMFSMKRSKSLGKISHEFIYIYFYNS